MIVSKFVQCIEITSLLATLILVSDVYFRNMTSF